MTLLYREKKPILLITTGFHLSGNAHTFAPCFHDYITWFHPSIATRQPIKKQPEGRLNLVEFIGDDDSLRRIIVSIE